MDNIFAGASDWMQLWLLDQLRLEDGWQPSSLLPLDRPCAENIGEQLDPARVRRKGAAGQPESGPLLQAAVARAGELSGGLRGAPAGGSTAGGGAACSSVHSGSVAVAMPAGHQARRSEHERHSEQGFPSQNMKNQTPG